MGGRVDLEGVINKGVLAFIWKIATGRGGNLLKVGIP